MRINTLRHKCLFYDATHLHSYAVIEKFKKVEKYQIIKLIPAIGGLQFLLSSEEIYKSF